MNKVILIGRLCTDVETRRSNSGKAVSSYRIAVDRQFKKEGQPEADFLNCVAFGSNCEFAGKYLQKGVKIAVEGSIQTRSYDNKDGKKVYVTEIIVDRHEFCESKRGSENAATAGNYGGYAAPSADDYSANNFAMLDEDDGQLPF
jgi:single-strand DNA-binding protein